MPDVTGLPPTVSGAPNSGTPGSGTPGSGAALPGAALPGATRPGRDPDHADVIVVGGGIGGLVAALGFARRGLRTLVLEAAAEPGGCVRLHTVAGLRLDRGADSFATARPAVADLAALLRLPVVRPAPAPAWVRHESGIAPLPRGALLGIPSDPSAADVRRVIGRAGSWRARADRLLPAGYAADAGLGELVRRRMGGRVLRRLVEPVVGGVYSTDPAALDTDAVAPGLRGAVGEAGSLAAGVARLRAGAPAAGSAVAGLVGGMGTLTAALVTALTDAGGELRCGTPVDRVRRDGTAWAVTVQAAAVQAVTVQAGTVQAGTVQAGAGVLSADVVVLALPTAATRPLLADATDGTITLPDTPASPVLLATLVVDEPRLDAAPRGSGVLVSPRVRTVAAKALTHATAKWEHLAAQAGPGRHVLRLSYGRGGATPGDDTFPDRALLDASDLLGVPLRRSALVDYALVRFPDQLSARRTGQAAQVRSVREALTAWPGLLVTGSAMAGTGLAAVVTDATAVPRAVSAGGEGRMDP